MFCDMKHSMIYNKLIFLTPIREFRTKNPNSGNWASVISGQNTQTIFQNISSGFSNKNVFGIDLVPKMSQIGPHNTFDNINRIHVT